MLDIGGRVPRPAPRVQHRLSETVEGDEDVDVSHSMHRSAEANRLRLAERLFSLECLAARVAGGTDAPLEVPVSVEIDAFAASAWAVLAAVLPPKSVGVKRVMTYICSILKYITLQNNNYDNFLIIL